MTDEEMMAWLEAFTAEHGFSPDADPELQAKYGREGEARGLYGDTLKEYAREQAVQNHLKALKWGQQFQRDFGRAPQREEYRYSQPREYTQLGELVGGFGGFPPEKIAELMAGGGGGGSPSKKDSDYQFSGSGRHGSTLYPNRNQRY